MGVPPRPSTVVSMRAPARAAARAVLVTALLAALQLVAPAGSASACSCDLQFPTVADSIGRADIAFVGRLDSTEEVDPAEFADSYEYFDVRYELIVEHAVKGVQNGDRVVMFGDVSGGSSCGTSELEGGRDVYAILSNESNGRFVADSTPPCTSVPSVDELSAVDLTLPATSPGPVSLVVVGRLGEAELISYGADGEPVAYGDLPRRTGQPAVCPGSERLVQLEHDQSEERTVLSIRDLATLEVIDRIDVVEPGGLTESSAGLRSFLVDGAVLECRSSDGKDVVGLLSWENTDSGQTTVVGIRPAASGGIDVASYGRTSRAHHDPSSTDVVGVRDGAFVRLGTDGASEESVVAQLTDGAAEASFDAVFVASDDVDGWWVGLGVGSYEIATELRVLVRVGADGQVERWPVENAPDYVDSVMLVGDRLEGPGYSIPLPAPGSSTTGAAVSAVVRDDYIYAFGLGDGRSVRQVTDDSSSSVVLIGRDGGATELNHLLEVRFAVGVPEGPTADSESIRREPDTQLVSSPWITPDGMPATDRQPTVVEDAGANASDASTTTNNGDDEQTLAETPALSEPTNAGSSNVWLLGVAGATALAAGVISLVLIRRRRRIGDAF